MSRDRFVTYGEVAPTREQVGEALARYLNGRNHDGAAAVVDVEWRESLRRYVARLPGTPSDAWLRPLAFPDARVRPTVNEERKFEVFVGPDSLDVITRSADDVTNAVADGFARACAYAFGTHEMAKGEDWWAGLGAAREVAAARAAADDALRRLAACREDAASASPIGGVGAVCRANADLCAALVEAHREALQLREELSGSGRPPTAGEARAVREAGGFFAWSDGRGARGTVLTSRRARRVQRGASLDIRWFAVGARDGSTRATREYAARDVGGEFALALWQRLQAAERRAAEGGDDRVARLAAELEAAREETRRLEAALAAEQGSPGEAR